MQTESDISQEIHQPFMVCVQNRSGLKKRTVIGKDCAKDFLNYIPHNSLVCFHNLAYDIGMFAHLVITKSLIK